MKSSQIDFSSASVLSDAVRWCHDPDKNLTPASALKHINLQQISNTKAVVQGYGIGNTWLQRNIDCQAMLGQQYLFDGEDYLTRVSKQDIWKRNAIRISQNKTNSFKLECINSVDSQGNVTSLGNINIPTYGGDLADFVSEDIDWKPIAVVRDNVWQYKAYCKALNTFSALRTEVDKPVWMTLNQNGQVTVSATERLSTIGVSTATCELVAYCSQSVEFAISGRFLYKTTEVFKELYEINIEVDDVDYPTRVRFRGDAGYISLEIKPKELCRQLVRQMSVVYGDKSHLDFITSRKFMLNLLQDGMSIQTPRKESGRGDIVLEYSDKDNLIIYKVDDGQKLEASYIDVADLDYSGEPWRNVVADHLYFTDALNYIKELAKYHNKQDLYSQSFEFGDELDESEPDNQKESQNDLVILEQYLISNTEQVLLFLKHKNYNSFRVISTCLTKEQVPDYIED